MSTTFRGSRRTTEVARELADEHGLPFITLVENELDDNAFFSLPERLIRRGTLLPYRIDDGRLQVAVADPSDVVLIDELRLVATMPVDPAVAPVADIARLCAEGPRTKRAERPMGDKSDTAAVRALDGVVADAIENGQATSTSCRRRTASRSASESTESSPSIRSSSPRSEPPSSHGSR
jgi:hypothetical protein